MLSEKCTRFREDFEIGGYHRHAETCAECRAWAEEISRLRGCGLNLPLPEGFDAELGRIARRETAPEIGTLPQMEMPKDLRAKLRRIPVREGRDYGPPQWFVKTRHVVAASYILAAVMVAALGNPFADNQDKVREASQDVTHTIQEAGIQGGQALTGVGTLVVRGCKTANESVGSLLGHLDARKEEPAEQAAPVQKQENTDGKRSTH